MVLYTLLILLFNAYAIVSGYKDSILWSRRAADAFTWNEHIVFIVERIVIIALVIASTHVSPIQALGATLAFLLMFSLTHNQAYYHGRSLIDHTPFIWSYSSTTSTAKIELNYTLRLALFLVGIAISVLTVVYV